MATPTQVVTLQDLNDVVPTLRLRLEAQSSSLASQRPPNRGVVERFSNFFENMFANAEEGIAFEHVPSAEATERNLRKIDAFFDKMEEKVRQQREVVKRELPTMTPYQQEQVLTFWKAVSEFIDDVFNWLKTLFKYVMDKIRQGFKIVKDAVKGLFSWIMECFKKVF
ncbi:hypothetical protein JTE90_008564 [Oedothorax gibbosus]|uniref:Uncharacterized protein n=1 Tax=Oedothorax gibbosus TaxID=931172 RepID=A0AAV6TT52_9ARAC|nr:hypothetical protein JTE90_008564 [Oedothorax gibbosus]